MKNDEMRDFEIENKVDHALQNDVWRYRDEVLTKILNKIKFVDFSVFSLRRDHSPAGELRDTIETFLKEYMWKCEFLKGDYDEVYKLAALDYDFTKTGTFEYYEAENTFEFINEYKDKDISSIIVFYYIDKGNEMKDYIKTNVMDSLKKFTDEKNINLHIVTGETPYIGYEYMDKPLHAVIFKEGETEDQIYQNDTCIF